MVCIIKMDKGSCWDWENLLVGWNQCPLGGWRDVK